MKWQAYSEYKSSGIEWLGEIPGHWEAMRFKYVLSAPLQYGANESAEYDDSSWPRYVRITDINENGTLREDTFKSLPEDVARPYFLRQGDLLLARSGATVGKTFLYLESWGRAAYAGYLIRARLARKRMLPAFAAYFCRSYNYWDWLRRSFIQATIQNVSAERYANLVIPAPSIDEQKAILSFLDRETERIDTLITKKERQIELLQEKRAALISQAVTKGVNPNVKMKDSCIEWLGEIPEHWETDRAKVLFREINERSTTGEEELLTVSHITGVTRRSEKNVNMFMAESLEGYKKCEPGDLVINTMWAWMGAMGIAFDSGLVSPSYNVYRFRTGDYEAQFYDYLFRTGRFVSEVIRHSKGVWTSRLRLYPEEFFEIHLPCPPLQEQRGIVGAIEKESGSYTMFQQRIEQSIEKLREYRTALISAAVTGKIDVRKEVHNAR